MESLVVGQTRVQQSTGQSVDPVPSRTSSSQPSVAPKSLSRSRFRPRGRQFKRSSSSSSSSGGSSGARSTTAFCGQCGGKHKPSQCIGVRGACNNCGQVGHFAKVCPTLGQRDVTRSSSRRSYRPFQPQRSGLQPTQVDATTEERDDVLTGGVVQRDVTRSSSRRSYRPFQPQRSGLQPTQVDATTEERDDVLTGGGCTVQFSCCSRALLFLFVPYKDARASGNTALSSPCWDLFATMRRVRSGLQPTQVDATTEERDDVLTGGGCTAVELIREPHVFQLLSAPESFGPPAVELLRWASFLQLRIVSVVISPALLNSNSHNRVLFNPVQFSCCCRALLLLFVPYQDARASDDTALSSPCWDLFATMCRVINYHSSWVGQQQVEQFLCICHAIHVALLELFSRGAVLCCITTIECSWRMLVELFPVLSCSDLDRGWRVVGPLAIPCNSAGGARACVDDEPLYFPRDAIGSLPKPGDVSQLLFPIRLAFRLLPMFFVPLVHLHDMIHCMLYLLAVFCSSSYWGLTPMSLWGWLFCLPACYSGLPDYSAGLGVDPAGGAPGGA
ncbi:hypothetical protein F511_31893 [Dorcoceras hygrometricum]|uniref:CCHC-type domain-containing protein n=1 Tax=Dorcoceras hygrometricum TaxID=472368 RepID=A0A2Z7CTD0_9LAMI|nr:hypothetical protein F511_31893 [Dorcoceras hygrometricum]